MLTPESKRKIIEIQNRKERHDEILADARRTSTTSIKVGFFSSLKEEGSFLIGIYQQKKKNKENINQGKGQSAVKQQNSMCELNWPAKYFSKNDRSKKEEFAQHQATQKQKSEKKSQHAKTLPQHPIFMSKIKL